MGAGELWDPVFGPGEDVFQGVMNACYRALLRQWQQEAQEAHEREMARWEDDGGAPCNGGVPRETKDV